MKTLSLIISLLIFKHTAFCQEGKSILDDLPEYPLKSIKHYCQADTSAIIEQSFFYYDEKFRLIKKVTFGDSSIRTYVREFSYNENGPPFEMHDYLIENGRITIQKRVLFSYNARSQVISEQERDSPEPEIENLYHPNGQLMLRTIRKSKNFRIDIRYKYNEAGLLVEKDFGRSAISYEYKNGRLIKEINYRKTFTDGDVIEYHYDNMGHLESTKEYGNAVKFVYKQDRLYKKYVNYGGIDPCFFYPCCSQGISVYTYH